MIENYTKSTQEIINKLSNKSVNTYIEMYGFSKSDVTAITHIESSINNLFHFDIVMHDHPDYLKIRQKLLTNVLESFIPIHASPNLKETIFKRFDQYAALPNEEMLWAKIANELFILNMEASLKGVMEEHPPLYPKNPTLFILQSMAFAEVNSKNISEIRKIKENFGENETLEKQHQRNEIERDTKRAFSKINTLLKRKFTTVQSGRRKGSLTDAETAKRLKGIKEVLLELKARQRKHEKKADKGHEAALFLDELRERLELHDSGAKVLDEATQTSLNLAIRIGTAMSHGDMYVRKDQAEKALDELTALYEEGRDIRKDFELDSEFDSPKDE